MAYTAPWVNTTPGGAELAATADDYLRAIKLGTYERMNSTLVDNWAADPVRVKDTISGFISTLTGRFLQFSLDGLVLSASGVQSLDSSNDGFLKLVYTSGSAACVLKREIVIPQGYTFIEARVNVNRNGRTGNVSVIRVDPTTGTVVTLGTTALAGAGIQPTVIQSIVPPFYLDNPIAAPFVYKLKFSFSAGTADVSFYDLRTKIAKADNSIGY